MNILFVAVFAASSAALLFKDAAAFLPALLAGAEGVRREKLRARLHELEAIADAIEERI